MEPSAESRRYLNREETQEFFRPGFEFMKNLPFASRYAYDTLMALPDMDGDEQDRAIAVLHDISLFVKNHFSALPEQK